MINIILIFFESSSIILLPKVINIYETFYEYESFSNAYNFLKLSQNNFILISLIGYFFILTVVFFFRILALNSSSNFANKVSIAYSKDFAFSYSLQDLDGQRFLSKNEFITYLQVKFPIIGREIFIPLTQVFSSFFLTLALVISVFYVDFWLSLFLISVVMFTFILVNKNSINKLKIFGFQIKKNLEFQGDFASDLYESIFLAKGNIKEKLNKSNLIQNDN